MRSSLRAKDSASSSAVPSDHRAVASAAVPSLGSACSGASTTSRTAASGRPGRSYSRTDIPLRSAHRRDAGNDHAAGGATAGRTVTLSVPLLIPPHRPGPGR